MLRNYLKLAWKVLLRRKFFTFVSLFGISFTLTVVMVVAAFVDHELLPGEAGSKFSRAMYVNRIGISSEHMTISSYPSYYFLTKYITVMKTPQQVAVFTMDQAATSYTNDMKCELKLKNTDATFFDVLGYDFLEGRPYDSLEVANADYVAVITNRARRQLFGKDSAVGKYFETNLGTFRVVGVISYEDIPSAFVYADVFVPITANTFAMSSTRLYANCIGLVVPRTSDDVGIVKQEFEERLEQARLDYAGTYDSLSCEIGTQQELLAVTVGGRGSNRDIMIYVAIGVVLMLLFMAFPAINLININISRIIERASEIGVRKAFGATSVSLVGQFLTENMLLTMIGGVFAFVMSLLIVHYINASGLIPNGHLGVSYRVFFYALLGCLTFGLLSGVIPAWRMSRLHPVEALKGSDL